MSDDQPAAANPAWPLGYDSAPGLLLVDDEANILNSLRRLLRPKGYRVFTAEGGEAALEILGREAVDLVVSDMRMPGMDGAQLLERVRALWPQTMRILLTGYADINSTIAAVNKGGIYRYISKPWNDDDILMAIDQALSLRGLERDRQRLQALTERQNEELKSLNAGLEERVRERTAELQIAHQELTLAMEKLKKNFFSTVQMLSNLIELRAPQLAGHGRRVADIARRVADKLGLDEALTHDILMAGLLHDIGKIGYKDELLVQPVNRVSSDDLGIVRKHPINGAAALMSLPDMGGVAQIIRSHHERWDGKGFPDGLAGQNIVVGARVLALANDYDAAQLGMLSTRKMSSEEAKQYVIEGRGFRYDPAVVDAFGDLVGRPRPKAAAERRISGAEAQPGMVLTRDLYSPDGVLLLSVDYVLDETLIKQIREYEEALDRKLVICVRA